MYNYNDPRGFDLSTPQSVIDAATFDSEPVELPAVIQAPVHSVLVCFYNLNGTIHVETLPLMAYTVSDAGLQQPVFYGSLYDQASRVMFVTARVDGDRVYDVILDPDAVESLLNTHSFEGIKDTALDTRESVLGGMAMHEFNDVIASIVEDLRQ